MSHDLDEPTTDEQWTCGKGLAEHAKVPAKIADLLAALAENLRAHLPTIDTSARAGRTERDAYAHLSREYEAVAAHLAGTAERMRSYRDLPAAPHHEEALADHGPMAAFERFVTLEHELAELLAASAEHDRQLLRGNRPAEG